MNPSSNTSGRRAGKSENIETLRGLACILLVAFHVVGNGQSMGLRVADDAALRSFADLMIHLRMPLFTFLSGFVYAYRPVIEGTYLGFLKKKLWRLMLPLASVSTIYFVLQAVSPGVNSRPEWSEFWRIFFFPYAHFWFLQAIILIFAVIVLLEKRGFLRQLPSYLLFLVLALLCHFYLRVDPNVFSVNQAAYLLPFFLLGLGVNRFAAAGFQRAEVKWLSLAVFAVTMTLHALAAFDVIGEVTARRDLFATTLGVSGLLTLYYWVRPVPLLIWIGAYSFTIYLYHVFFTAGVRVLLERVGFAAPPVVFVVGCALGILGPMAVESVLRRNAVSRRILLGQ